MSLSSGSARRRTHSRIRRSFSLAILSGLAVFASSLPSHAQIDEKEAQRTAAEAAARGEAAKAAARAAEEAERLKFVETGEEVTREQALAEPENIDLNYRYARGQLRRGNLAEASAALERILKVKADLPRVRLLHAVILYNLGELSAAERELAAVKDLPMPETLRSEIRDFLGAIDRRLAAIRLSGRLSLGFEYNDNRNSAPGAGQRLVGDTPTPLTGSSERRQDTNSIAIGNLELTRNLDPDGDQISGSFTYYRADQTAVKNLSLQAYSLEGAALYKAPFADIVPSVLFDHVLLDRSTFLRNRGASLRLERKLTGRVRLYLEARDVFQDYVATAQLPTGPEYRGVQIDVTLGAELQASPSMRVGAGLGHSDKHAQKLYNAFDRYSLSLSHLWLTGKETFVLSNLVLNQDRYLEPDPAVSRNFRTDATLRARATWGTVLSIIHPCLKDFLWTLSYEYYHAFSTVRNYDYSNNKIQTLLTYRWEIGIR